MDKGFMPVIKEYLNSLLEELGYELVDLEFKSKEKRNYLNVYVYHTDGVDLDFCSQVSSKLGNFLDEKDLIKGNYYLVVSSPGLDRLLKSDDDLRRNLNKVLDLKLYSKVEGKKEFRGILKSYDESRVIFDIEGCETAFERKDIASLKQAIIF